MPPLWLIAVVLAVLWGGWARMQAIEARSKSVVAEVRAKTAEQDLDNAKVSAGRVKTIQEAVDAANLKSAELGKDRDRALAAVRRLQAQRSQGAQQGPGNPSAAQGSTSAPATGGLPAEVLLGRCGERMVELADYADRAHTAGQLCERSYDALTQVVEPTTKEPQ